VRAGYLDEMLTHVVLVGEADEQGVRDAAVPKLASLELPLVLGDHLGLVKA
jgi:hypothetical protein